MARTRTKTEKAEATGTVQQRRAVEKSRQKTNDQVRAQLVAELEAANKATAARLKNKPTDSRTLATPDPNAF